MPSRSPRWNHEQILKALVLYFQLPFGKMHSRTPAIMALAEALGRTPSAVAMMLSNFASFDPKHKARGVKGLPNASRLAREVWDKYHDRWSVLGEHLVIEEPLALVSRARPSGPTEVERFTTARRGQSFFRSAVIAAHEAKCCITGITCLELLRASHIVPWSADESLRLDPRNGLCLNALHDAAFDRGLITLSDRFELRVSKRVRAHMPIPLYAEMFAGREGTRIAVPERFAPSPEMLEYHRTRVFRA